LTKAKGIEDAFEVALLVRKRIPQIELWVIGQGDPDYVSYLKEIIAQKDLQNTVRLLGYVDNHKKFLYMAKAHLLVAPSHKEGWGLTIPEAGAVGTPVVAYDVPGLRDILKDNKGGVLVKTGVREMAEEVKRLLDVSDTSHYRRIQTQAKHLAGQHTWDHTAKVALDILELTVKRRLR